MNEGCDPVGGSHASTGWLPLVLQTTDPLFPTGAYAHSLGLEEMCSLGLVRDEGSLREYLASHVLPGLERVDLPYLREARAAALADDLEMLVALAAELDALKVARELRAASAALGSRRMQALRVVRPSELLDRFEASGAASHHALVSGVQFADVPLDAALAAYFYQTVAGCCTAALKLIRIGQEGCQRVLTSSLARAEQVIARSLTVARGEAGWFDPLLDIAGMRHEVAEERLFIS